MKHLLLILCLGLFVSTGATSATESKSTEYGAGVKLSEATAIETLIQEPDTYVGKTVRIDGVITGVCKKRGCWIQVTNPDTGNGIRMKVEDGVIVFPMTSMGQKASAEGVFQAIKLPPEQVKKMNENIAKKHHEEHAAKGEGHQEEGDSCKPKPINDTIFQLEGTGAIIYG